MHADIQACKHVNTRACMHVSMYACEHVCMHEHVHACRARTTQRIKAMQSMAYTILINKKNFQKKWVAKATICMRMRNSWSCDDMNVQTRRTFMQLMKFMDRTTPTHVKTTTKKDSSMRMPPNMSYHVMALIYHAGRLDSHVVQHACMATTNVTSYNS